MNTFVLTIAFLASIALALPIDKDLGYSFDINHHHKSENLFGQQERGNFGFGQGISGQSSLGTQSLNGGTGETQGDLGGEAHHFPSYKFSYGVKDLHTGDIKDAWEHRHGDHVEGEYSLVEADGTHRIVKYKANAKDGFNAVVKTVGKGMNSSNGSGGAISGQESGLNGGKSSYSYQKVSQQ